MRLLLLFLYLMVALAASANKPVIVNHVKPVEVAGIKPNIVTSSVKNEKNIVKTKFRQLKGIRKNNSTASATAIVDYADYNALKPPAIVVDGYNVIGYLTRENGIDSLEDARDELIADLRVLAGTSGWFIEVVFDAYKATSFSRLATASKPSYDGIKVTYTSASETADNYIENRFNQLKSNNFTNMVVATDDNLLRLVAGSMGSGYLSCEMLVDEIKGSYSMWENMQLQMTNTARTQFNNMSVENMLNEDIKEVYRTMKEGEMRANSVVLEERNNKNIKIMQEKEMKKKNRKETVTMLQSLMSNSSVVPAPVVSGNKTDKYQVKSKPTLGGLLSTSMKAAILEQMKREEEQQKREKTSKKEAQQRPVVMSTNETVTFYDASPKSVEKLLQQKQEIEARLAMLKQADPPPVASADNKPKKKGKQAEIRFR